jgi:predicted secreted protein
VHKIEGVALPSGPLARRGRAPHPVRPFGGHRLAAIGIVLALALVAASCGDEGGPVPSSTEARDPASTSWDEGSEDPDDGGTVERSIHGVDLSELDLPAAEAYDDYLLVEDDTEQVEVEIPAEWTDVDTRLAVRGDREVPGIWASTDLEALSDGYVEPGVQVDLRTATSPEKLFELLDSDNAAEASCSGPQTFDYDDGLYQGTAELWTDCTETGAALLELVVLRAGNQYVTVEIQMSSEADVDAALRALDTFAAVKPALDEQWQAVDTEATVHDGEEFTVVVRSNPSTGDDWKVADGFDTAVVSYLYEDYESDDPSGMAAGAGGTSFFSFRAVGPGTTTITLENCFQCTDGVGDVSETRSVEVVVEA